MSFAKLILPSKFFDQKRALASFEKTRPYFTKPTPRPYQAEIIGTIRAGIEENDFKNVFLQLGVGEGKSVTAIAIAEYFRQVQNRSYYLLSMDLGLTQQYKNDFNFLKEVKGRNNFPCSLDPNLTASEAQCVTDSSFRCPATDNCPYIIQRNIASLSLGTLSTPYYIDRCCPNNYFDTRYLAIRDECHKLESFYLSLLSSTISESDYSVCHPSATFPLYTDPAYWKDEIPPMIDTVDSLLESTQKNDDRRIKKLTSLSSKLSTIADLLSTPDNAVIDIEKTPSRQNYFAKFRPVKVSSIASDRIKKTADHTIFMSGTILSINDRLDQLGLDPDDCLYITKTTSVFPDPHRRIIYDPQGSMSYKQRDNTLPKIIDRIVSLLTLHPHQRGVIICGSHKIRQTIHSALSALVPNPSDMITHSDNFESQFNRFVSSSSDSAIFITTRYEGLDFHGKLAEFLVYINLPYPPPMDKQINARLRLEQSTYHENHQNCGYEHDPSTDMCRKSIYCNDCKRWYNLQIAESIQQAIGRIIRTPNDIGTIYILDNRFKRFLNGNDDLFLPYNKSCIYEYPKLKRDGPNPVPMF